MSAINDALRRASGAAVAEPPGLPTEPPALPGALPGMPVDSIPMPVAGDPGLPPLLQPPPEKKSGKGLVIAIVLLFALGAAAGIYLWQRSRNSTTASKTSGTKSVSEATIRTTVKKQNNPVATPEKAEEAAPEPKPVAVAKTEPEKTVAPPTPAPAPAPSPAPVIPPRPVVFPQLRLQGIYYKPSNPSVMINNRALFVGDQIQGVTVAAVEPSSVTLVLSGQTNILTLR